MVRCSRVQKMAGPGADGTLRSELGACRREAAEHAIASSSRPLYLRPPGWGKLLFQGGELAM